MPKFSRATTPSTDEFHVLRADRPQRFIGREPDSTNYAILAIDVLPNDTVWLSGLFGAVQFAQGHKHSEANRHFPRYVWFKDAVWETGSQHHLIRTYNGQPTPIPVPFRSTRQLLVASTDSLIAVSPEGLWSSDTGTHWEPLAPTWATCTTATCWSDLSDTLWITTNHQGEMYRYHLATSRTEVIPLPNPTSDSYGTKVIAGLPDHSDGFWASIDSVGICQWNGRTWQHNGPLDAGVPRLARSFCFDHQHRLWAVVAKYVCRYDQNRWTPFLIELTHESTEQPDLLATTLRHASIRADTRGILWIGTYDGECYCIDPQQPEQTRPLGFLWATDWGTHWMTDHFHPLRLEQL